jgi:hypothetical protein
MAERWARRVRELAGESRADVRNSLLAEAAYFDVLHDQSAHPVQAEFADVDVRLLSPEWVRYRVLAALYFTAGDSDRALTALARAQLAFTNRSEYFEFERDLLIVLHRRILGSLREAGAYAA